MKSPKENTELVGHQQAYEQLLADWRAGRLHHGLLITGPQGCGKATLAYRLARVVLSGDERAADDEEHPTFRRVASGSHSDLLIIEQEYDEKKGELAREIPVDSVRRAGEFFSRTSGEGFGRVAVVDAADAMNNNASNALLKVLEEPPSGAFLLLVCHAPAKLLPTIRSRCRQVKLAPLTQSACADILQSALPEEAGEGLWRLCALADNSPGLALELHQRDAIDHYAQLLGLLVNAADFDERAWRLSADVASGAVHAQWQAIAYVLKTIAARAAKTAAGQKLGQEIVAGEGEFMHKLAQRGADFWANFWQQCDETAAQAANVHLDYRQTLLSMLHSLSPNRIAA